MIRAQLRRFTRIFRYPTLFRTIATTTTPEKQGFIQKSPLLFNLTVCVGFGGLGDFIEQMLENGKRKKEISLSNWDKIRTSKFATAGISVGFICHYWYLFLDKRFMALTTENLVKKILLCQFVHSPICIIAFFLSIGYLNNWTRSETLKNIHDKGMLLYQAEWLIWPPALLFSFYFLPTQSRVLFDSIISLGFDVFNSFLVYNETPQLKKKKKQLIFLQHTKNRDND